MLLCFFLIIHGQAADAYFFLLKIHATFKHKKSQVFSSIF